MTKVHSRAELRSGAESCLGIRDEDSCREIRQRSRDEVSVLGNHDPKASVPAKSCRTGEFYDYAAKYLEEGTQLLIAGKTENVASQENPEVAIRAFRTLELSGMARVDFFLEKKGGKLYLNEVNTIPGFTSISSIPNFGKPAEFPFANLSTS